jgi:ribosome-binding protein aMBF1 (putative translation factor)
MTHSRGRLSRAASRAISSIAAVSRAISCSHIVQAMIKTTPTNDANKAMPKRAGDSFMDTPPIAGERPTAAPGGQYRKRPGKPVRRQPSTGFGAHLRDIREGKGLSQRELASRSGLSHTAVSRIESGDRPHPGFETIAKIESGLGEPRICLHCGQVIR